MPLYEYVCGRCGPFSGWGSMQAYAQPASCSHCGTTSPRMVASPNLARSSHPVRLAHERNERSAHEPRVMRREQMPGGHDADAHHDHAHPAAPPQAAPLGKNLHRSTRRWMIGH
jgi:putative FmdB family regulatory protein